MSDEIRWVQGSDERKVLEHRGLSSTAGSRTVRDHERRRWVPVGMVHAVNPATGLTACERKPRYVHDSRWEGNADPRCEDCVEKIAEVGA